MLTLLWNVWENSSKYFSIPSFMIWKTNWNQPLPPCNSPELPAWISLHLSNPLWWETSKITRLVMCSVDQSCPALCNPMDCSPPGSSVHRDSPGKNTGVGCHTLLQGIDLPNQGTELKSPAWQADYLPSEPPWNPPVLVNFPSNYTTQKKEKIHPS